MVLGPLRAGLLSAGVVAVVGCGGADLPEAPERDRSRGEHGGGEVDRRAAEPEPERDAQERRPADRFPGPEGARAARVAEVTDGDTISLSGVGKVRLIGVDTPEVFGGVECFGRRASAFTKRLLPTGRRVRYRLGVETRDRYGRALAYVWLPDGRMVNGLLAERGFAQPLTIQPNSRYADRFRAAARRARRAGRGLWGVPGCADEELGTGGSRGGASDAGGGAGGSAGGGPRSGGGGSGSGSGSGRDRDCGDFSSQAEAQRYFESIGGGPGRNADGLDADGDGEACESLG